MVKEALAVLDYYGVKAGTVSTVEYKKHKAVWKITNNEGTFFLKKTPTDRAAMQFVLAGWKHLFNEGVGTPVIIPARSGESFVSLNRRNYILMTGMSGQKPEIGTIEGKCNYMRFLAQFHQASKSFQLPPNCLMVSQIGSLPGHYENELIKLQSYRKDALKKRSRFTALFLEHVSHFCTSI